MKFTKLSLVAAFAVSSAFAGGDIAPVQTPVEEEKSGWDFSGQAVVYTQSVDSFGTKDLFSNDSTYAATGVQLRAINENVIGGIGVGIEVSAILQGSTLTNIPDTPNSFLFPFIGGGDAQVQSGDITQAYLTYGFGNTKIKIGRQTLPKSLSPFCYSEGWQMFKNTMEAALVVNNDLPDTTLVYAAVGRTNSSIGRLDNWDRMDLTTNNSVGIIHMITAQNKSIDNLTLTGTYYYAPDMMGTGNDANILWGDAKYKYSNFLFALQGGQIAADTLDNTNAFGVMVKGKFDMFDASIAYSSADGPARITNLATIQHPSPGLGIKSPLYTQMVLNNIGNHQAQNADYIKIAASTKLFGGKVGVAYGQAVDNYSPEIGDTGSAYGPNPYEIDLTYKTKITKDITIFAAYVFVDRDRQTVNEDPNNFVRFWARYNF